MNRLSAKKSRLKPGFSKQENGKTLETLSNDIQRYDILIKKELLFYEKVKNDN